MPFAATARLWHTQPLLLPQRPQRQRCTRSEPRYRAGRRRSSRVRCSHGRCATNRHIFWRSVWFAAVLQGVKQRRRLCFSPRYRPEAL